VLVHHVAKGSGAVRGSGALVGAADTVYTVEAQGSGVVKLKRDKSKDTALDDVLQLRMVPVGDSVVLLEQAGVVIGADTESVTRLLEVLQSLSGEAVTSTELQRASGLTRATYYRARKTLEDRGLIIATGPAKALRWSYGADA